MSDVRGAVPARRVSSSSRSSSTWGECPAKSTPGTGQVRTPASEYWSRSRSSAAGSPETVTEVGPLTAATSSSG